MAPLGPTIKFRRSSFGYDLSNEVRERARGRVYELLTTMTLLLLSIHPFSRWQQWPNLPGPGFPRQQPQSFSSKVVRPFVLPRAGSSLHEASSDFPNDRNHIGTGDSSATAGSWWIVKGLIDCDERHAVRHPRRKPPGKRTPARANERSSGVIGHGTIDFVRGPKERTFQLDFVYDESLCYGEKIVSVAHLQYRSGIHAPSANTKWTS